MKMMGRRWFGGVVALCAACGVAAAVHANLAVIGYQQPLPHTFIDSLVQSTELATDLRNFVGTTVPSADSGVTGTTVFVFGTAALGDGGAGTFYWNAASTAADDGGTNAIKPSMVSGAGRWLRAPITAATGGSLVTVTATGAVAVGTGQSVVVWSPTVPAAATFTLPATPTVNESHEFKNALTTSAYPMTIAANSGQTIDGNPYEVLTVANAALGVKWAGSGNWIIVH